MRLFPVRRRKRGGGGGGEVFKCVISLVLMFQLCLLQTTRAFSLRDSYKNFLYGLTGGGGGPEGEENARMLNTSSGSSDQENLAKESSSEYVPRPVEDKTLEKNEGSSIEPSSISSAEQPFPSASSSSVEVTEPSSSSSRGPPTIVTAVKYDGGSSSQGSGSQEYSYSAPSPITTRVTSSGEGDAPIMPTASSKFVEEIGNNPEDDNIEIQSTAAASIPRMRMMMPPPPPPPPPSSVPVPVNNELLEGDDPRQIPETPTGFDQDEYRSSSSVPAELVSEPIPTPSALISSNGEGSNPPLEEEFAEAFTKVGPNGRRRRVRPGAGGRMGPGGKRRVRMRVKKITLGQNNSRSMDGGSDDDNNNGENVEGFLQRTRRYRSSTTPLPPVPSHLALQADEEIMFSSSVAPAVRAADITHAGSIGIQPVTGSQEDGSKIKLGNTEKISAYTTVPVPRISTTISPRSSEKGGESSSGRGINSISINPWDKVDVDHNSKGNGSEPEKSESMRKSSFFNGGGPTAESRAYNGAPEFQFPPFQSTRNSFEQFEDPYKNHEPQRKEKRKRRPQSIVRSHYDKNKEQSSSPFYNYPKSNPSYSGEEAEHKSYQSSQDIPPPPPPQYYDNHHSPSIPPPPPSSVPEDYHQNSPNQGRSDYGSSVHYVPNDFKSSPVDPGQSNNNVEGSLFTQIQRPAPTAVGYEEFQPSPNNNGVEENYPPRVGEGPGPYHRDGSNPYNIEGYGPVKGDQGIINNNFIGIPPLHLQNPSHSAPSHSHLYDDHPSHQPIHNGLMLHNEPHPGPPGPPPPPPHFFQNSVPPPPPSALVSNSNPQMSYPPPPQGPPPGLGGHHQRVPLPNTPSYSIANPGMDIDRPPHPDFQNLNSSPYVNLPLPGLNNIPPPPSEQQALNEVRPILHYPPYTHSIADRPDYEPANPPLPPGHPMELGAHYGNMGQYGPEGEREGGGGRDEIMSNHIDDYNPGGMMPMPHREEEDERLRGPLPPIIVDHHHYGPGPSKPPPPPRPGFDIISAYHDKPPPTVGGHEMDEGEREEHHPRLQKKVPYQYSSSDGGGLDNNFRDDISLTPPLPPSREQTSKELTSKETSFKKMPEKNLTAMYSETPYVLMFPQLVPEEAFIPPPPKILTKEIPVVQASSMSAMSFTPEGKPILGPGLKAVAVHPRQQLYQVLAKAHYDKALQKYIETRKKPPSVIYTPYGILVPAGPSTTSASTNHEKYLKPRSHDPNKERTLLQLLLGKKSSLGQFRFHKSAILKDGKLKNQFDMKANIDPALDKISEKLALKLATAKYLLKAPATLGVRAYHAKHNRNVGSYSEHQPTVYSEQSAASSTMKSDQGRAFRTIPNLKELLRQSKGEGQGRANLDPGLKSELKKMLKDRLKEILEESEAQEFEKDRLAQLATNLVTTKVPFPHSNKDRSSAYAKWINYLTPKAISSPPAQGLFGTIRRIFFGKGNKDEYESGTQHPFGGSVGRMGLPAESSTPTTTTSSKVRHKLEKWLDIVFKPKMAFPSSQSNGGGDDMATGDSVLHPVVVKSPLATSFKKRPKHLSISSNPYYASLLSSLPKIPKWKPIDASSFLKSMLFNSKSSNTSSSSEGSISNSK